MLALKIISALLAYPQAELAGALDEIEAAALADADLPEPQKQGLLAFVGAHREMDLIAWQQQYVELFDRGRALSLLMFEHVHGESRDRGQAMANLLRLYQLHGFELAARELPDYAPLFLEFLAQLPRDKALELLCGALPVLNLLGARLAERESPYTALFAALAALAGEAGGVEGLRGQAAAEGPDESLARMDEIWEEEAVSFMGNSKPCRPDDAQPLNYAPRRAALG